jgi:hypothetical protein
MHIQVYPVLAIRTRPEHLLEQEIIEQRHHGVDWDRDFIAAS